MAEEFLFSNEEIHAALPEPPAPPPMVRLFDGRIAIRGTFVDGRWLWLVMAPIEHEGAWAIARPMSADELESYSPIPLFG